MWEQSDTILILVGAHVIYYCHGQLIIVRFADKTLDAICLLETEQRYVSGIFVVLHNYAVKYSARQFSSLPSYFWDCSIHWVVIYIYDCDSGSLLTRWIICISSDHIWDGTFG